MIATSARPGFAAALAVTMIAALAGLAGASHYAAVEARRAANRSARQEEAASAADAGIHWILDPWDGARRDSMALGAIDSIIRGTHHDFARTRAFVTRITERLFWVASVGESAPGTVVEASRVHSLLVEVLPPVFPAGAALTSRGPVLAGTGVAILGSDAPPPGWTDCVPGDSGGAPAVLVPEGVPATFDDGRQIPGVGVSAAAADSSTYDRFGRVTARSLAGRADVTLAAGAMLSPPPDTAIHRAFPVIVAVGDLTVTNGRGQGVLLVNGRLRIEGPFSFFGVVVASRGIEITGPDVTIYGAVLSAGSQGVAWRAGGELRRSTCAVARAAIAAARDRKSVV